MFNACSGSCHFHVVASTLSLSGIYYRDFNLETVLNMADAFYLQIFIIVIFSCLLSFGRCVIPGFPCSTTAGISKCNCNSVFFLYPNPRRQKVPKSASMVLFGIFMELFGLVRDKNHSLLTKYLPTRSLDKCTESVVMGSFNLHEHR